MHTSPPHALDLKPEAERATRLLLTVWMEDAGRWCARADLPDDETHVFDSPFELARFLTQLAGRRVPQAAPAAGGGLR